MNTQKILLIISIVAFILAALPVTIAGLSASQLIAAGLALWAGSQVS